MSGLFISFEGIDGVGKSTQIDLLQKHLGELGRKTLRTLEPGEAPAKAGKPKKKIASTTKVVKAGTRKKK